MHFLTLSTKEGVSLNNPGIARLYLCCLCSVLTGFGSNWLACNTPPGKSHNTAIWQKKDAFGKVLQVHKRVRFINETQK